MLDSLPLTAVEVLTSWECVYFVIFLPSLLMGANFVFGNCSFAEWIEGPVSNSKKKKTCGRLSLVCVYLCLAWQFHVRRSLHARGHEEVRILGFLDVLYYGSLSLFIVCHVACAVSHSNCVDNRAPDSSYCSKCACRVAQMDHHCFFVNNCIGSSNIVFYILLLCCCTVLCCSLLFQCGGTALAASRQAIAMYSSFGLTLREVISFLEVAFGLAFTFICLGGSCTLLAWQYYLRRVSSYGRTVAFYKELQKERRRGGMALLRALLPVAK